MWRLGIVIPRGLGDAPGYFAAVTRAYSWRDRDRLIGNQRVAYFRHLP